MFKILRTYKNTYTLIPPTSWIGKTNSHSLEAQLLKKSVEEYFLFLKVTFSSARLIIYPSFISYSMKEQDVKRLERMINREWRKINAR